MATRDAAPSMFVISTADGDIVLELELPDPDPDDDHVAAARTALDDAGAPAGWYGLSTAHGPTNPDHIDYRPPGV